jgi:hypothetical protein
LTVEHRAAASSRPLVIGLAQNGPALALQAVERAKPVAVTTPSLDERVTAALRRLRLAEDVVALDQHVAKIDADAIEDALCLQ